MSSYLITERSRDSQTISDEYHLLSLLRTVVAPVNSLKGGGAGTGCLCGARPTNMRLEIQIDGYYHIIDSTNPDLLAQWTMEIFARAVPMTPATLIRVRALPSYVPNHDNPNNPMFDWIADSRYLHDIFNPRTPHEMLEALQERLAFYEKEKAK